MREIEERGAEAVIAQAIDEALDGPDAVYLSLDIDVIDPGLAPGTGTPEPGGMLTREVLRAVRQIVGAVELSRAWTSSRSRRRTTTPRRRRWPPTGPRSRPSARWPCASATATRCAGPSRTAATPPPRRPTRPLALDRPATPPTAAALARLYDLDLHDDPGDLDLYLALAERADGPILELAAGTGRLAVPLAEAGHAVTAVDLDPAMLARARRPRRRRPGVGDDRLRLVEADLLGPPPARRRHVRARVHRAQLDHAPGRRGPPSARRSRRSPRTSRPGGLAVVDVWLPDADDLARFDGRLILEWPRTDPETGARRDQDRARRSTTRRPARSP